jgi:hypothetical protein
MKYRLATPLATKSLDAAGTETLDIKLKNAISRIEILGAPTKSKNEMDAHPAADMTKIELVDGSDVLFSASGKEAQAINAYDQQLGVIGEYDMYTTLKPYTKCSIDFGRYLFDEILALDPTRFSNLQLKITHAMTTSDSGAAAYNLAVYAHVFDEKAVSPTGFLTTKSIKAYTPGSQASYEYITIPTDRILRKLFIRAARDAYLIKHQIQGIRLNEDNDARVPLEIGMVDYLTIMKALWRPVTERINISLGGGTNYLYFAPGDSFNFMLLRAGAVSTLYPAGYVRGGKVTTGQVGTEEVFTMAKGICPHQVVEIPFGKPELMEDWYDVTKLNSLELRLEAGSSTSSGAVDVLTQQLRKY